MRSPAVTRRGFAVAMTKDEMRAAQIVNRLVSARNNYQVALHHNTRGLWLEATERQEMAELALRQVIDELTARGL